MVTRYKPTQWRGKTVVYRSLDPNEKREGLKRLAAIMGVFILIFTLVWFFQDR
jgi:hypothetical protein